MAASRGSEEREVDVDLNYLFHRQQVERTMVDAAESDAARKAHEGLARGYENEITRATHGNILFPPVIETEEQPGSEAA